MYIDILMQHDVHMLQKYAIDLWVLLLPYKVSVACSCLQWKAFQYREEQVLSTLVCMCAKSIPGKSHEFGTVGIVIHAAHS